MNLPANPTCPSCGHTESYPAPGPYGLLVELLRLGRFACRRCQRTFWRLARPFDERDAPMDDGEAPLESPVGPAESLLVAGLDALDTASASARNAPPDLAALDLELARLRGGAKKRRGASRDAAHP